MATVISRICDPCQRERGEETPARTRTVSFDGGPEITVDVCPTDEELIDRAQEFIQTYGQRAERDRTAQQVTAPCPLPRCGQRIGSGVSGMIRHLRYSHRVEGGECVDALCRVYDRDLFEVCDECGHPAASRNGLGSHKQKRHGIPGTIAAVRRPVARKSP